MFIRRKPGMRAMTGREKIDLYDLVEVIQIPESLEGVIDLGDVGVVVEKHNDRNFHVECVQPGGPSKWLATLNVRYIRLRSKDPYSKWVKRSQDRTLMQRSVTSGAVIGAVFGIVIGAVFGAITMTLDGVLIGAMVGSILGIITGVPTAALTAKIAGTTGGIGAGYFIGMVFGGVLGLILGALVPPTLWMSAQTEAMPVLSALMQGRFETAISTSFLLSVLATIVGSWIAGNNLVPRDLKDN
ncbi:MAG TPA: hypothetical protein VFY83_15580 [Anaerolineales bacterium]|jgi:hypothetical protein|nr:hypothetical protein [Anaerolineales bacterium]